jgi:predicted metal-dependent hydrolase
LNAATARIIEVNGQKLSFSLRRSPRRTLAISVEPDGRVVVTAPELASPERIEVVLARRFPWIKRQQRYFEALPPPPTPRQWVSGETHRYLGRQYRLKVIPGETPSVRLTGAYFHVATPDPTNTAAIEQAMAAWYHSHARTLFADRMAKILKDTTWLRDLTPPPITVRHMPKRWGSATPSGRIYLNVDLVKLPPGCIDYVIAHELVHLKIPNHGRAFWRLLGRVCPEWGRWRDRLAG